MAAPPIVVKIGGSTLGSHDTTLDDLVDMQKAGKKVVVVHGGGTRIKKKLDQLKIETKFIMGLRVTDEKVIKIVEDVMIEFNKEIVVSLEKKSCKAKSITVKELSLIHI